MSRHAIIASACSLLLCLQPVLTEAACTGTEQVRVAAAPAAVVETANALRKIEPHFFGFSFVWVEFQESLWNDVTSRVEEEAIKWLQAFPGALYRYPGGTESNYYDWKASVGPPARRESRKAVKWKGPLIARFGLDEYLDFVREVGGQPWYVANLFGGYDKEGDPRQLAEEARQLAAYLKNRGNPGERVMRWELGNELDRGEYLWSADKYLAVARQVAEAIRRADPQARFVAIMEDYDAHWRWRRTSAAEYNRKVAAGLADLAAEYAQHSYYDGVNVEVPYPVSKRITQICKSIGDAETVRSPAGSAGMWITELARQPVRDAGNPNWKPNWSKSANFEAALGLADFMIAATQVPQINGLFVHALHGLDAPWPLFHKTGAGRHLNPSALYWTLSVLRQAMLPEVMQTSSQSANAAGYLGGYDFRATVMADAGHTKWAAWAVNRAGRAQSIELRIPALAGKKARVNLQVLADDNLNANNYLDGDRLRPRDLPEQMINFDKTGSARLVLVPYSVTAARLDVL